MPNSNPKPGDYFRVDYTDGSHGWGRLEHRVTAEDRVPNRVKAQVGDWLWVPMRGHMYRSDRVHPHPLSHEEVCADDAPPQDRLLWLDHGYGQAGMVVLNDVQYIGLHALLRIHDELFAQAMNARERVAKAREEADEAFRERQAKKEATKRLGGPDRTSNRRESKGEAQAKAAVGAAEEAVRRTRIEIARLVTLHVADDVARRVGGYLDPEPGWRALCDSPRWNRPSFATDSYYGLPKGRSPVAGWMERQALRRDDERQARLEEALKPPRKARKRCTCGAHDDDLFLGDAL